jgi:hypothetical protein
MRNLVNLANFGHCLVSLCRVLLMTSQLGSKVMSWTFQIGLKVVQEFHNWAQKSSVGLSNRA